jgi:hypothetical protein|tara:strand:- start:9289 stop:10344 length:1056 start_codon:yes stop_codon:yes gene_type:complete
MAVYKLFPTKDASLYSEFPSTNTGLDQVLEASTYLKRGIPYVCRYLIEFSTTEITDILNNRVGDSSFATYLRNYSALVTALNTDSKLEVKTISGSWDMGTGVLGYNPPVENGCSWFWRSYSGSNAWVSTGSDSYANPVYSQSFSYGSTTDINVDVTPSILSWHSGSIPNDGFLIKQPDAVEFVQNPNVVTTFRYFSIDTNTIYPPSLEFKWDDYIFNTSSSTNTILGSAEAFISVYNNEGTYYSQSVARMRLAAIPKYPLQTFSTASEWTTNFFLPENVSLYAIKDTTTNEFVVDFDSDYTRISADYSSSYFDVYMNGLEPERYYTILIKTVLDGTTKVFDEDIMFKVVNG